MAKMNVLATYTVTVKNGVVTAVGDVPQGVLDYIQKGMATNIATWKKKDPTKVVYPSGTYQVTLWDTGNMEMTNDLSGGTKVNWADVPASTPRAATVTEWLQLAQKPAGGASTKPGPQPFVQAKPSERDITKMLHREKMLQQHRKKPGRTIVQARLSGAYTDKGMTRMARQGHPGWRPMPGVITSPRAGRR